VNSDTIFALSSGRLPAAIAVVRISGPHAGDALVALAGRLPAPRQAMLARLRAPPSGTGEETGESGEHGASSNSHQGGEAIDDALVLWFPGPASETGEDTAELQLHGGRAVVTAALTALGNLAGLRPAEAGEFTRRAFLNGKLDLTRVEGLADLIGAETEAQRRQAFRQLKGLLGDRAETWRKRAIDARALIEAAIDFPDEDVPQDLMTPALTTAAALRQEIVAMLGDGRRGERLRDGLTVAVVGPVNVGKSSIVNRLAKRPAAIVSPYAGTTRDVIEVHLDLAGYPVTVLDTAGLRDAVDPVEQEGVRRARVRAAEADLILWVADATALQAAPVGFGKPNATEANGALATQEVPVQLGRSINSPAALSVWSVINKCDLLDQRGAEDSPPHEAQSSFRISAETGDGFDVLMEAIARFADEFFTGGEAPVITRERHRHALQSCADALGRALAEARSGREDIVAEELRLAAVALGRLTGRIDVEDVLDVIFRDFCIGK
jgi:tRNA modification GTPase